MQNQEIQDSQGLQKNNDIKVRPKPNYWKGLSLLFAVLFLGTVSIFVLNLQKIKEQSCLPTNKQQESKNIEENKNSYPTSKPQNVNLSPTVTNQNWISTDIAGGGVSFKYPEGWHVIYTEVPEGPPGSRLILIGQKPFHVTAPQGPDSDFWISIQNGLANPEEEFNKQLNKQLSDEKKNLVEIKEETLSSKYFDKIYHIKGKIPDGDMMGGTQVEKYFFMLTNPKYFPTDGKININIFSAGITNWTNDIKKSEILKQIILSVKECHHTWCENE